MSANMKFNSNLPEVLREFKRKRKAGLQAAAIETAGAAKTMTPVDTGRLRASIAWAADGEARVHKDNWDENTVIYEVTAPLGEARIGTNVNYAIYVHEDLDAHHPTGEAKFLENAIRQKQPRIEFLIRSALAGEFDV